MGRAKPPRPRDREATRATIVDAARLLFRRQGYSRTTIPAIAERAAVAPQTIYWAFRSKAALVAEIRERWLAGARTGERLQEVLAIADPAARLDAYAAFTARQWESGAQAIAIQQDAMRADPDVAGDVRRSIAQRAAALLEVVRPLAGVLRGGMSVERAHGILLALSMAEVYLELRGRGWSHEAYQVWLRELLQEQLLGPPARAPGRVK